MLHFWFLVFCPRNFDPSHPKRNTVLFVYFHLRPYPKTSYTLEICCSFLTEMMFGSKLYLIGFFLQRNNVWIDCQCSSAIRQKLSDFGYVCISDSTDAEGGKILYQRFGPEMLNVFRLVLFDQIFMIGGHVCREVYINAYIC